MNSINVVLSIPVFLFSGYTSGPPEMNPEHVTKFVKFGDEIFSLLKGKPVTHKIKRVKNLHIKNHYDEWHTAIYPGCKVVFYRVLPEKRDLLSRLQLNSSKVQLPYGIRIGLPVSAVIEALGKPTKSEVDSITYEYRDIFYEGVTFKTINNTIVEITWEYEID